MPINPGLPAAIDHMGHLGRCLDQEGQVALGLVVSVLLDCVARVEHEDHGPAGPVLLDGQGGKNGHHCQDIHADMTMTDVVYHSAKGVNKGNGDQNRNNPLGNHLMGPP